VEDIVRLSHGRWILGFRDVAQLSAMKKFMATYHARAYSLLEERPCNPVTIQGTYTVERRDVRPNTSPGVYAVAEFRFEPSNPRRVLTLEYANGGQIPEPLRRFYPSYLLESLLAAAAEGKEFGRPVVGLTVTLLKAAYHPIDSHVCHFQWVAQEAFAEMLNHLSLTPL
jgi:translation elongation factor EF-G